MRGLAFVVTVAVGVCAVGCGAQGAPHGAVALGGNATTEGTPAGKSNTPDSAASAAAEGSREAAAPTESWREITVPSGTKLAIVLETPIGSDTSEVEQPVRAHLSRQVLVDGVTVLPQGSTVSGVVTDAKRSGKVKGLAHLAVRFDTVVAKTDETRYRIETATVSRTAHATKEKDAVKIGAPAAGGAIIGGILGGKKGALIGGATGAGAGTAVVMSTRGEEVRFEKGTAMTLSLSRPLKVRVKTT